MSDEREMLAEVLSDADCPDDRCDPQVMGGYYRYADAILALPQFARLITAAEARGAERVRAAIEGVIASEGQQHIGGHRWIRDDWLRAALTAEPEATAPSAFNGYEGTCPKCGEVKFIGHGPLCVDCFTGGTT